MKGSLLLRWRLLVAGTTLLCAWNSQAGEPWLAPGNVQVRHDIQLLVDSGVINLPMSGWPIAISDLANALSNARSDSTPTSANVGENRGKSRGSGVTFSPAQSAALSRLRRIASEGHITLGVELAGAGRPTQLRTFADTPREEGEISVSAAGFVGQRFGGRLEVTAVADPDDGKDFRVDGSYVAGKFGNWIVTLGEQDRWWGSGWEGSLILSNNARPLQGLEISVERTAQWCGEGRSCTWDDFWNLFWGNDNAGENVDPEDEPGNQLASWDIRWASPIGHWNYALYNQHTGETIDNQIPRPYRSFDVVGLETWGEGGGDGSSWRAGLEWSNSRCGGTENEQRLWDCAYNNGIFNPDGYRYYGRPLGHSMDGDGQMYSLRYVRVDNTATTFTAVLRYSLINEGGAVPDERHSIAPGPEDWISLDLTYRREMGNGWIEGGVGVDQRDQEWANDDDILPRAWLTVNWPLR
jgi:hypothetical protein